jgi:hypothetical protein
MVMSVFKDTLNLKPLNPQQWLELKLRVMDTGTNNMYLSNLTVLHKMFVFIDFIY